MKLLEYCGALSRLLTVILADAINLGLTKMAEACPGSTFNKLARERMRHRRVRNLENERVQNTRRSPDQLLKQTTCGSSRRNLNLRRSRLLAMHNQRALLALCFASMTSLADLVCRRIFLDWRSLQRYRFISFQSFAELGFISN